MVSNAKNALYEVKKKLYHNYSLLFTREWWVDHGRKAVIQEQRGGRYYVLFKRLPYLSYEKLTGESGNGETINVEDFEYAVYELDITEFVFVYQNNTIYKIRARELRTNCRRITNEADNKDQYLFSQRLLQKL